MCSRLILSHDAARLAGFVGRRQRFRHHAFVSAGERVFVESLRFGSVARHETRYQQLAGQRARQRLDPLGRGGFGQRVRAEAHAVEEEHRQRQRRLHCRHVERAPEPAHRDLERLRRAIGLERNRLAVENQLRHRARAHGGDDLGRRGGHVVAIAREYPHVVAGLVHLDARAVELPLEGRRAERLAARWRHRPPVARASAQWAASAPGRIGEGRRRLPSVLQGPPGRSRARPWRLDAPTTAAAMPPPRPRRSSAIRAHPGGAHPARAARESRVPRRSRARRAAERMRNALALRARSA